MTLNKLVFLAIIFLMLIPYVGDNDFWLHLRTGEIIIEDGYFPKTDVLSFSQQGKEWINHEWLPQIIFYSLFKCGGFFTVVLFVGLVGAALFALLLWGRKISWPGFSFLLLIAYSLKPFMVPRPQIFAYLLLTSLVFAIGRKKYLWMPIILFFWANVHASVILALPILALVWFFEEDKKNLTVWFFIGIVATLVNPFGYKLYLHALQPLRFSEAYHFLLETRPIHKILHPFPYLLITHVFIIFIFIWEFIKNKFKNIRYSEAAIFVMFIAMPFMAVKYTPFSWVAVLPTIIKIFPMFRRKFFSETALVIILGLSVLLFLKEANLFKDPYLEWPKEMIGFIKENKIQGNIYHPYSWGGYVTWATKRPIFINAATTDLGGDAFWDSIDLERAEKTDEIIKKYDLSVIIAPPWMPLPYAMSLKNDWALVYWDNFGTVFAKRSAGNDDAIARYSLDIKYFNDSVESQLNKHQPNEIPKLMANYREAIRRHPDLLLARYRLGLAYKLFGDCTRSIREFEELIKIDNKLGSAHFRLAECYKDMGKIELAVKEKALGEKFVKGEVWWKGRR